MTTRQPNELDGKAQPAIALKLHEISQLFNSMDPSPFHEKDLDDDAEQFIFDWARELPPDVPLTLVVHLEQYPKDRGPESMIQESIQHFFKYKALLTRREFKHLLAQGRISLVVGLTFLITCLLVGQFASQMQGPMGYVTREGFTIGGWVAMWRPMQIFLYEWWPLRRRYRLYERLSEMTVLVRPFELSTAAKVIVP